MHEVGRVVPNVFLNAAQLSAELYDAIEDYLDDPLNGLDAAYIGGLNLDDSATAASLLGDTWQGGNNGSY